MVETWLRSIPDRRNLIETVEGKIDTLKFNDSLSLCSLSTSKWVDWNESIEEDKPLWLIFRNTRLGRIPIEGGRMEKELWAPFIETIVSK